MLGAALIATLLSKKVVFIYIPHSDAGEGFITCERLLSTEWHP